MPSYDVLSQKQQTIKDTHEFASRGRKPNPHMKETATSAPLIWESRTLNSGEDTLASQGESNISTIVKTGF